MDEWKRLFKWLRTFAALPGDPSLDPSTHIGLFTATYNAMGGGGIQCLLVFSGTCTYVAYTHTDLHTYMYI